MNSKEYRETPGRNTEEKKKLESSEKPLFKTETVDSLKYQEGTPLKTDLTSKGTASDQTESQHSVEEKKKKWHSPPIVPPHIQGDKYHNPFDLKALEKQTKEKGNEALSPYEEMKISSKNPLNAKEREALKKEGNEYDSNSFEAEDSPGHEYQPHEEEAIKNEIRTLGKKERDILRESLSNMKQEMENNKKVEEIPEEIASEGPESKVEAIEPIKDDKSRIEILEKNEQKPKAKIVCQALFANSVPFGSQSGMRPYKIEMGDGRQKEEKKEMWSSPSKTFQAFLERLQKLDSEKIQKLVKALDVIESESKLSGVQKGQVIKSLAQPPVSRTEELLDARKSVQGQQISESQMKEKELAEQEEKEQKGKPPTRRNELIFRILSTWGHPHVVGLTEIALFDKNGKVITTPVKAKNLGAGIPQSISKLTNGKIYTNDERSMWVGYLPLNPKYLELVFTLPQGFDELGGVVVWNYNKNSTDSTKGVRDASLIFNRTVIWTGTIKKGYGRLNEDYSTEILLCENKAVFKEKPRFYASESEKPMPKDLLKRKKEQENGSSRPISVPTWLDDSQTENSIAIRKPEEHKQTLEQHSTEYTYSRATESIHGQRREYYIPKSKPKGYPFYSNNSGITSAKEIKRVRNHEVELKPAFNNRKKHNTIQDQRDQSMERHIDNLIYFEASKPTRLLKKKQEQKKESQRRWLETKDSDRMFPTPQKETAHKNETKSSPRTEPVNKTKHTLERPSTELEVPLKMSNPELTIFEKLKMSYASKADFAIPELPRGRSITFDILSTWDDQYYVGLSGIEIFTMEGLAIPINPKQINAEPRDINILPEYGTDPRTIDKLVDGTYFTRDDLHVWLAPYNFGQRHYISIDLGIETSIALIRIWNYNKSRVHAHRGIRDLIITLDNKETIFMGEIRKAPGTLSDIQQCSEVIMFTSSDEIMKQIALHDWVESVEIGSDDCVEQPIDERPSTASKRYTEEEIKEIQSKLKKAERAERPLTTATSGKNISLKEKSIAKEVQYPSEEELAKNSAKKQDSYCAHGSEIVIDILETWGDVFYVGLTGIELFNEKGDKIPLTISNITASPKDLNSIPGYSGDYRTIDKLIDGHNLTADDKHMWLIPFNLGLSHKITLTLSKPSFIQSIKFYNYNKSVEDTNRGAKLITITIDKKLVTPKKGIIVRKAPGRALCDFGHNIALPFRGQWNSSEIAEYNKLSLIPCTIHQEYVPPSLPSGFIFEIFLYSNHGDNFYIGLNGLEMYDTLGRPLLMNSDVSRTYTLSASPTSVRTLKGMENDIRTVDKLVDGENDTIDDRHMWLAPFTNTKLYAVTNREVSKVPNLITIVFDQQIAVSAIKIWNYAKTPKRGANEFALFCDNRLIYRGYLKQAIEKSIPCKDDYATTLLFTQNKEIVEKMKDEVVYLGGKEQDVTLVNEKAILTHTPERIDGTQPYEIERPLTCVVGYK